jgi:peptidoglycan/xylan/chitin deacetylase (PgdA/CDA1 family)
MYFIKNPKLLKKMYPSLVWDIPSASKTLYLTFDDGPIPEVTPFVLETLAKYNAKATFFCIGDNVRKHPEVYEQVVAAGHSFGNHTYNHLNGWRTDTKEYLHNIELCTQYTDISYFRPPYGRILPSQIKGIKKLFPSTQIIMWDVLSGDFDESIDAEKCFENVTTAAESGSIIVFHDSIKAYPRLKDALPRALDFWSKTGYTFQSIQL